MFMLLLVLTTAVSYFKREINSTTCIRLASV